MKYTFTLAAVVAIAAAQGIADIPSCSLSCFTSALPSTGCGLTDFKCSCAKADTLTPALVPCVQKACPSAADQQKVIEVLGAICAAAGVPINPPSAPAPSSPAPAPEQPSAKPEEPKPSSAPSAAPKPPVVSSAAGYPAPSAPAGETCVRSTVTVTVTKPVATVPPYPTGPVKPSTPAGTAAPTGSASTKPTPPEFTGAAAAVQMPVAFAGVFGLAALFL